MSRTFLSLVATGMVLALGAGSLQGAPSTEETQKDVLKKMYLQLSKIIEGNQPNPNTCFQLRIPGLSLSPGITSANEEGRDLLNLTLNTIPRPGSANYESGDDTYTGVFENVIRDKQTRPGNRTPEQEKALAEIDAKLIEWDLNYNAFAAKYEEAVMLLNSEIVAAKRDGRPVNRLLEGAVTRAMNSWRLVGKKEDYERLTNKKLELDSLDTANWWTTVTSKFEKARDSSSAKPLTTTIPAIERWNDNTGWTTFTFASRDKVEGSSFSAQAADAATSISVGKFSASASGGWSKEEQEAFLSDDSTTFTVELKRVFIYRPWFDANLLKDHNWRMLKNDNGGELSNGVKNLQKIRGRMPLLLQSIIIARKLKITSNFIKTHSASMKQAIHARASVSYGPFSISGGYSNRSAKSNASLNEASGTVEAPDPQIIAFLSNYTPKAPSPVPPKW